ncbi:reverse transcriptase [Gossypium australe]|uniref:Reverse transcriptase n=1 Tax=Gossypium australe TaxID=47621 RepID=A0A5B6VDS8_9ROSI|nr:reverse transcriptase [Gossypium australe]
MEKVRRTCGYVNGIDVGAKGSRGGLSLGWKDDISISLKSFSKAHIDVEVVVENKPELKESNDLPWLVLGDFNEVIYSFEKRGGRLREER